MPTTPLCAEKLWDLPRVGSPELSSDGEFLVFPVTHFPQGRKGGLTQLHRWQRSNNKVEALTAGDESSSQPRISADGRQLSFVRKVSKDEEAQLWLLSLKGGEAKCLTQMPHAVTDPQWLADGSGLLFLSEVRREAPSLEDSRRQKQADKNALSPVPKVTENRLYRFWDSWLTNDLVPHLFHLDLASGELRDLTPHSKRWFGFQDSQGRYRITPDGLRVFFVAESSEPPYSRLRSALYELTIASGEIRCLTPDHAAGDSSPRLSSDGQSMVYGTQHLWDFYADRTRLILRDTDNGEERSLFENWDRSPSCWRFDASGESIIVNTECNARSAIYRLPIHSAGEEEPQLIARGGSFSGLQLAEDGSIYACHHSLNQAPEIVRIDSSSGEITTLTDFATSKLKQHALGTIEELTIAGADGDAVQCFVILPPEYDPQQNYPLVHIIHGGPHGMLGDAFNFRWNAQCFAAQGYIVAQVNFHGSTSFGQDYAQSIQGEWGDKPCLDLLNATDELIAKYPIDADRIAITGASYGGYLTSWLAAQTSRFRCAINHAGVVNFSSMYGGDITQGWPKNLGGRPWQDVERTLLYSPTAHMHNYRTPTLVTHGELDYRVPIGQGLEIYGLLQDKGVPARLVVYADENHWILKRHNSEHWYGEVFDWLKRWLKPESN